MSSPLAVVILAAGKGTRMKSELPKALVPLCGKPMLWHLLEAVKPLKPSKTVVVSGFGIDAVKAFVGKNAVVAHQKEQLGSGHALLCAKSALSGFKGNVLVLYCDTPLLQTQTLKELLLKHIQSKAEATLLSTELANPFSYGRIIRSVSGLVEAIIEENDLTAEQKAIREINVGCYAFRAPELFEVLKRLPRNEKKNEIYLTDAVAVLSAKGPCEALLVEESAEIKGINTRQDLFCLTRNLQNRILLAHSERGVWVKDPQTTTVDAGVEIGNNTVIFPHTVIEEDSQIGRDCRIGPFARIRGGSTVGDQAVIGNFVEIVRSRIGRKSQVKHLSYLGDAVVGEAVNVGAGTITANYDGKAKHATVIKDGAQIGSGTVLVAPVTVGKCAKTGAGAVVPKNRNVPDGAVVAGVPARILERKKALGKKS